MSPFNNSEIFTNDINVQKAKETLMTSSLLSVPFLFTWKLFIDWSQSVVSNMTFELNRLLEINISFVEFIEKSIRSETFSKSVVYVKQLLNIN